MSGVTPQRIRLSRAKGFNLQSASRALNGLPAVNVARPGKWGNRYGVIVTAAGYEIIDHFASRGSGPRAGRRVAGPFPPSLCAHRVAVDLFREWMRATHPDSTSAARAELKGKNLACWCEPWAPCHADVLLKIANEVPG